MQERAELDPQQEDFYPVKFDRTPYGACWAVAAITGAILIAGIAVLWNTAGFIKKTTRSWHLPKSTTESGSSNLVSDIESRINPEVKESVSPINPTDVQNQLQNKLEDTATQAVQNAADKAVDTAVDQTQQEILNKAQELNPAQ